MISKLMCSQKRRLTKKNIKNICWSIIRGILIVGISFIILRPVLVKISSSLMVEKDLFDPTVKWVPKNFTLKNYFIMFKYMNYLTGIKNTLIFSLGISFLQLVSCTIVGYGLARFKFKGNRLIFTLVILTLVVPPQITILPSYLNFRFFNMWGLLPGDGINLIGTYWPFILMAMGSMGLKNGLFIYIMRQFFKGMPSSLEEAAYVDGAGRFKTFYKIMLPSALPAMIIVFLFAFVWQWNDYFFTSFYLEGGKLLSHNLDLASQNYAFDKGIQITGQYISLLNNTGMLLFMAPLLVLYAFLQRHFIESIERTGIVG